MIGRGEFLSHEKNTWHEFWIIISYHVTLLIAGLPLYLRKLQFFKSFETVHGRNSCSFHQILTPKPKLHLNKPQKMVLSTSKYSTKTFFQNIFWLLRVFKVANLVHFIQFWLRSLQLGCLTLEFKLTNIKIFFLWTSIQIDTRVKWTVYTRINTA